MSRGNPHQSGLSRNLRLVGFDSAAAEAAWRDDQAAALEVTKENRLAAYASQLDPRDPRWMLAMQTADFGSPTEEHGPTFALCIYDFATGVPALVSYKPPFPAHRGLRGYPTAVNNVESLIAAALIITEHTVKFHIRSILGKLGAANRTEAVTLALQKGLVSL